MPTDFSTADLAGAGTSLLRPLRESPDSLEVALKQLDGNVRDALVSEYASDLYTSAEVMAYARSLNGTTEKEALREIAEFPVWKLVNAPLRWLKWRRDRTNPQLVERYMHLKQLPPAVVANEHGIVLDGWHRCESRLLSRCRKIPTLLPLPAVIPARASKKPCYFR